MKYLFVMAMIFGLNACQTNTAYQMTPDQTYIDPSIPTIGIIIFNGVITNEILAPLDVFAKHTVKGEKLFNVIFLAAEQRAYITEEGMRMLPDFTFDKTPKLNVLVVPSSYEPEKQYKDEKLVSFVQQQYDDLDFVASHCAGAFTLGATGLVDQKELVTYITGGESLQKAFPNLKVQDDAVISVARDGKVFYSNGSLVSYLGSLDLLEALTNKKHRKYVEESLYLDRMTISN